MKNVSHKKSWRTVALKMHVDPPPINLIKINNDVKSEKYCVKISSIEILHQKNRIYRSLKWTCLKTASHRSSCCSCKTSK